MSDELPEPYEQLAEEARQHLAAGDVDRAIAVLKQASRAAGAAGETLAQAALLNSTALAQERGGYLGDARTTLERVVALLQNSNAADVLAQVLDNLGFIERELGNLNTARQHHEEALALFERLGDQASMGRTLTNLGLIHKDQGRLTEARASFERALLLLPEHDDPRSRAHALTGLGLTLELLHDTAGARDRYLEALACYRQAEDRENEALVLHNLGKLDDDQEEYATALDYYQQALTINQAIGAQLGIVDDLSALAVIYQITGDLDRARQMHEELLRQQETIGHRRGLVWTLSSLAFLDRDDDRLEQAEQYLTRALALAQEMADLREEYEAYLNRGDVRRIADQIDLAVEDYVAAAEAAETLRGSLLLEEEALGYFDQPRLEVYDRLVVMYSSVIRDPRQALVWAECARAREFLRRLRLTAITPPPYTPDDLCGREAQLLAQLRQEAAALADAGGGDVLDRVRIYEAVEQNLQAIWVEMEAFDQEYVALRRGEPVTWNEIRSCVNTTL